MKKQIFKGTVKYDDGFLLDIGWYPEGDPDGEIAVLVVQNYDWDNPVYEERCNDLPSLLNIIKAAEKIILCKRIIEAEGEET